MKVNTSKSHKRFNTQHINNQQNVVRIFLFILGLKYKTLHVKPGFGLVGKKTCKKLICTRFDWSSLIFDRSSLANLANKSYNSLDFNFTNKYTLSSQNLDSKFWSWFANTLHIEVLIHLVPKVLEPNKLPLWQSLTKHITKLKCSKLQTAL